LYTKQPRGVYISIYIYIYIRWGCRCPLFLAISTFIPSITQLMNAKNLSKAMFSFYWPNSTEKNNSKFMKEVISKVFSRHKFIERINRFIYLVFIV
jgi:hypothetical protein